MKALLALVPITVFAAASCATGKTSPDPGVNGGDPSPSSGRVATCTATCGSAADCGTPGDPLYDSSHFACTAGQCIWQGCRSAAECSAEAHGGNFVCQATASSPVPSCNPACQKAADCVPPGDTNVLDDASHYACTQGSCEWLGCKSTAECSSALHTNKVSCEQPAGAPGNTCVPTCTSAGDCGSSQAGPLNDASHYTCKANRCQWLGCKSTAECAQVLQSSRYVCE
jgi:hypothetical protein